MNEELMKEIGRLLQHSNSISLKMLYDLLPDFKPFDIRCAIYELENKKFIFMNEDFEICKK